MVMVTRSSNLVKDGNLPIPIPPLLLSSITRPCRNWNQTDILFELDHLPCPISLLWLSLGILIKSFRSNHEIDTNISKFPTSKTKGYQGTIRWMVIPTITIKLLVMSLPTLILWVDTVKDTEGLVSSLLGGIISPKTRKLNIIQLLVDTIPASDKIKVILWLIREVFPHSRLVLSLLVCLRPANLLNLETVSWIFSICRAKLMYSLHLISTRSYYLRTPLPGCRTVWRDYERQARLKSFSY